MDQHEILNMINDVEMEDLKLETDYDTLLDLLEAPVWKDINRIISVFMVWETGLLVDAEGVELLQSQGRCKVLREITQQIEFVVKDCVDKQKEIDNEPTKEEQE